MTRASSLLLRVESKRRRCKTVASSSVEPTANARKTRWRSWFIRRLRAPPASDLCGVGLRLLSGLFEEFRANRRTEIIERLSSGEQIEGRTTQTRKRTAFAPFRQPDISR